MSDVAFDTQDPMLVGLRTCLARLVDAQGRVHCRCRSRVLESSLALRLLEAEGGWAEQAARLRAYLGTAAVRADATELDRVLGLAALGRGSADTCAADVLTGFEHHSAHRKRVLLDTILYLVGAMKALPQREESAFALRGLHRWKQPEMVACRVVHAHEGERWEAVEESDLALLRKVVSGGSIYEGNNLTHLLCLSALQLLPGHGPLMDAGVARLLATLTEDGGLSLAVDMDTWTTSVVGLALAEAGARRELTDRICAWLGRRQLCDGSWSFTDGVSQTDVDTAYTGLGLLHRQDPMRYAPSLDRGHDYLERMQNADGGWPVYRHGNPSEAAMTGGALTVLTTRAARHGNRLAAGAAWLVSAQKPDGTFERGWSLAEGNAIVRAVDGLNDAVEHATLPRTLAQAARRAVGRSIAYLTASQNPDGGWGHRTGSPSDPASTGFALAALSRAADRKAVPSALAYLRGVQRPDGGFDCLADTAAPRPLVVDIPALGLAYVLRGLARSASAAGR
ncbi:prenyltransferase/squalene oxidase repeat-containing protein [Streptomyces sp. 7N604]|uniref:prenyltransferase/squalene oxidase repeat-containing protein n=1 Tax=Streptomyces sp. 7N604 TaxID=3457415 RepID=UPI003FD36DD9